MLDQADKLRQLVRETVKASPALGPGVPLVVVSGGSRGVGTSELAFHLARETALLGRRVVLADANLLHPRLAERVAVVPRGGLAQVLEGSKSATESLESIGERLQLLPGCDTSGPPPSMTAANVQRLLTEIRGLHSEADVVFVDAGHGMSPWVERLWTAAFQVLLVTAPDRDALTQSYAAVKLAPWGDVDGKLRLVVNRCDDVALGQRIGQRFAATCQQYLSMQMHGTTAVIADCQQRADHSEDAAYFLQGVRLLAAEVVRNTLVVSHRTRGGDSSSDACSQAARLFRDVLSVDSTQGERPQG